MKKMKKVKLYMIRKIKKLIFKIKIIYKTIIRINNNNYNQLLNISKISSLLTKINLINNNILKNLIYFLFIPIVIINNKIN